MRGRQAGAMEASLEWTEWNGVEWSGVEWSGGGHV